MKNSVILLSIMLVYYAAKDAYNTYTYTPPEILEVYEFSDLPEHIEKLIVEEDALDLNNFKEPVPIAVPVMTVQRFELFPWEDVKVPLKKPLLDCDKAREDARTVLACNIYHEARSEPIDGQWVVGFCTRNRVHSAKFPDTYQEVVWQIRRSKKTKRRVAQFSWALDGKPDKIWDKDAWRSAWTIAGALLDDSVKVKDITDGCLFYHANYVHPDWAKQKQLLIKVGKHITYK